MGARTVLTAATILVGLVATRGVADLVVTSFGLPSRGVFTDWAALLPAGLLPWVPGTRVGYRWRDLPLLLIPFYSLFLAGRIVWRWWFLPYADWSPRPEDAAKWQLVPHPARPGTALHVRSPHR